MQIQTQTRGITQRVKRVLIAAAAVIALTAALTGCDGAAVLPAANPTAAQAAVPSVEPTATVSEPLTEPENTAALIADFTYGSSEPNVQTYELGYSGELTPEILVEGLSDLTGLDFSADAVQTEYGISVTWELSGTLVAGLGDREPNDGFRFYDIDSLRWFMMDSMYRTLTSNFGGDDIFYSAEDGELVFEELYPTNYFPARIPYMGSAFYFAHADGRGYIYSEDEASDYLLDQLTNAGLDIEGTAVTAERDAGDPWFGEMAVWYFLWGKSNAEKRFAVTYDWQVWEYDAAIDEWTLWE